MTASTIKSSMVTNAGAPESLMNPGLNNVLRRQIDTIHLPTTSLDDTSDKSLLCLIPSNAYISRVTMFCDDMDTSTGLVFSLGVANGPDPFFDGSTYYAAYAEIAAATWFVTTATQAAIGATPREAVGANFTTSALEIAQQLWKRAGLASDPTKLFVMQLKVTTVATTPAAGDVSLIVDYSMG